MIPSHGRLAALAKTLAALDEQTVSGFEVIIVVDGLDQPEPAHSGVRVLRQAHQGPGAARNRGVEATIRPLILFLGADMIPTPDLVATHLQRHAAERADHVAVLGGVHWHPSVARNRLNQWLDWSATQFDYRTLNQQLIDADGALDAGFGRFYSCNVSLKRSFFVDAGGFDPAFRYYYEDLDCGWRLAQNGMILRYEPAAVTHHLHAYNWDALVRRFEGISEGERMMAAKHSWFEPFFRRRVQHAMDAPAVARGWVAAAGAAGEWPLLGPVVRERADRWYHQQLAPAFLSRWLPDDLDELMAYLGDAYDERRLHHHVREVEVEEEAAPNETTFYRTSEAYLYDLTVFALSGTKDPYRRLIRRLVPPGSRLLDYGCGIGSDGLRLIDDGYRVEFADFANPSTRYLAWRLARRGLHAPIHDIEQDVPTGFDLAYCFDVLEHVEDPYAVLQRLESLASIVVVNLLEPEPGDTHVHKPLDVPRLLDYAASRGLRHYRKWYGRSHLIAYVSHREGTINSARSFAWRRVGDHARMASLFERTEGMLANAVHRSVSVTRGG